MRKNNENRLKVSYEAAHLKELRALVAELLLTLPENGTLSQEVETALRAAIRSSASKGLIRTHALVSSWIKDYVEKGVLAIKLMQEIVASTPWSWAQTKKYLESLEQEGILIFGRNQARQKVCGLLLPSDTQKEPTDDLLPPFSEQLVRLLRFYAQSNNNDGQQAPLDEGILRQVLATYRACIFKEQQLVASQKEFAYKKQQLQAASSKDLAHFIENLVESYLVLDNEAPPDPVQRLLLVLRKAPLMFRSLKSYQD